MSNTSESEAASTRGSEGIRLILCQVRVTSGPKQL
jgi:hypothetical protein